MTKKQLRELYKDKRKKISFLDKELKSEKIANQLLKLNIWDRNIFHIFLTIKKQNEINTEFILSILNEKNKQTVISKSDFSNNTLSHFLFTQQTKIKINSFGIPEPFDGKKIFSQQIEVVYLPLLIFDKKGHRVGYGKGFYDKFLLDCAPNCLKIGLSFFEPVEEIVDTSTLDQSMDFCITPNKIYKF